MLGSIIGGALSGIGAITNGILGYKANKSTNEANMEMNRENIQFQKETNAQNRAWQVEDRDLAWGREDTSIQRRVQDLKASGLNPLLAAGGGAQASMPMTSQATAPENKFQKKIDYGNWDILGPAYNAALDIMQKKSDIENSKNNAAYVREQARGQKIQNDIDAKFLEKEREAKLEGIKGNNEILRLEGIFKAENDPLKLVMTREQTGNIAADTKTKELVNRYNEATMENRIQTVAQNLKNLKLDQNIKEWESLNAEVDHKLREIGVDQAQVDLVRSKLEKMGVVMELGHKEQQLLAKTKALELAVTMAEIQAKTDKRQYDTLGDFNLGWLGNLGRLLGYLKYENDK
jgi:hypothetical protein